MLGKTFLLDGSQTSLVRFIGRYESFFLHNSSSRQFEFRFPILGLASEQPVVSNQSHLGIPEEVRNVRSTGTSLSAPNPIWDFSVGTITYRGCQSASQLASRLVRLALSRAPVDWTYHTCQTCKIDTMLITPSFHWDDLSVFFPIGNNVKTKPFAYF